MSNGEKPDLYLDVDGVLLLGWDAKGDRIENTWLIDYLLANKDRFARIIWLSCWTGGGSVERLYEKHPRFKDFDALVVKWGAFKTSAIDWTRPFIWIEDGFSSDEADDFARKAGPGQYVWQIRLGECYKNLREGNDSVRLERNALVKTVADKQEEIVRRGYMTHIERAEKDMWTHRFYELHHEVEAKKTQDHDQAIAHRELAARHSKQAGEFEREAKDVEALMEQM